MRWHSLTMAILVGCSTTPAPDGGEGDGGLVECQLSANPDPCLTGGLACTPDYTGVSSTGAYCEPPGEFFSCLPFVGCATPDLQCLGADAGVPGGCVKTCTTTADCWDPLTVCSPLSDLAGPSYCLLNLCNNFWQRCAAATLDGGDGMCIYIYDDPVDGPIGGCLQGGSVPGNGPCNYYRGPSALLCEPGQVCLVDGEADNSGVCFSACDAIWDGGPECSGLCVSQIPPAPPPSISAFDIFNQAGGCTQLCPTGECASNLSCGTFPDGTSACLPP